MDPTQPPTRSASAEEELRRENAELRQGLAEAQARNRELMETIDAIRLGAVDAIVVAEGGRYRVYTLEGANYPYRALVENIQEGALTLTPEGSILFANAAFAALRGLPLADVPGTPLADHVADRDRPRFDALLRASRGGARRGELNLCSGAGSIPVQLSLTPITVNDDTTISVVVTDRRQDYGRLRLLARMLDSVVDAVTAVDPDGTVVYWNEAAERLYGWQASEMIGRPMVAAVEPGESEEEARQLFEQLASGDAWSGEYMARNRDGRCFPVAATRAPVYDEDGELIAVIGTSRDITERMRAEEELRQAYERTSAILESISDGFMALDRDWRFTYINRRGIGYTDRSAGDVIGRSLWEVHPEIRGTPLEAFYREAMNSPEPLTYENQSVVAPGLHFELRAYPTAEGLSVFGRDITERTRAEAALRDSEERFRTLYEHSHDAIILTDPRDEGCILSANPAACRMLGWAEEELVGLSRDMVLDSDDPGLAAVLQERERGGAAFSELTYRRRDGSTFRAELSTALFTDSRGDVRAVAIIRDVTERKRFEHALAESEADARSFMANMVDACAICETVCDADGVPVDIRVLDVNPALTRKLGLPASAIVGRTACELLPEFAAFWLDRFLEVGRSGRAVEVEEPFPALGRWYRVVGFPVRGDRTAVLFRDITLRKRAMEALAESEERYRSLVENSIDAVLLTAPDGAILAANAEACRIFGMTEEELIRGGLDAVLDLSDPQLGPAREERRRTGRFKGELSYRRKDGTVFPGEVSSALFTDPGGAVLTTMLIRDITDRKEAEAALREYAERLRTSNEELQRFAYVASHDLQEPLRSIVSFSQLLEKRYRGKLDQDADEFIGFIVEGGMRMQNLIQDLLQVSRVETGAKPPAPTDTGEAVNGALRTLEAPIREAGASVTVEAPLPAVMADASQLEQVFVNLVGNAIKYRREGVPPAIRVEGWRVGPMVEFSVQDNGIGIEEEYFGRIFEMFRRLHTHDQYGGTGIGLAVVKKIVERHGGRVWVESTPGEGSTFFFTLPAA